jgi:hypothetical protein
MFLNFLLVLSFIGIFAIGYMIYYYRKKYNSAALLSSEKQDPGLGFKGNQMGNPTTDQKDLHTGKDLL